MSSNDSAHKQPKMSIGALVIGDMKWPLTGLVTGRTGITEYKSKKGPGQVFSFELVDDTSEIRVSVFGRDLQSTLEMCADSSVVRITGGTIKQANAKFNTTDNELEMSVYVDYRGSIHPSNEVIHPRTVRPSFTAIGDLPSAGLDVMVNVVGVIVNVQSPEEVLTSAQKRITVAKVTLVDQSRFSVSCTFWASSAAQVNAWSAGDILEIRNARAQEYANCLVLGCSKSKVHHEPRDLTTHDDLALWYQQAKSTDVQFEPLHVARNSTEERKNPAGTQQELVIEHPEHFFACYSELQSVRLRFGNKEITFVRKLDKHSVETSQSVLTSTQMSFESAPGAGPSQA